MIQTINNNNSSATARNEAQQSNEVRTLMRILDWEIISADIGGIATEAELAENDLQNIKLSMETSSNTPSVATNREERLAFINQENNATPELNEESSKYKGCAPPRKMIVKLLLTVISFADFENELRRVSRSTTKEIGQVEINMHLTKVIEEAAKSALSSKYYVAFNTNEFLDFNLDPTILALEVTAGAAANVADPKLVAYSEDTRYAIPGNNVGQESKATQNVIDSLGEGLKERIAKVKAKINDKKSQAEKDAMLKIENGTKVINCGTSYIEMKSKDPSGKKSSVTPGEDGVKIGSATAGLNMSKWYHNASKKVQYATTPFAIDYKGWKPNLLGKYFASDNNIQVPTWKQNLGLAGDELIKIATSIAALKAFQLAIDQTGIKERLDEFAQKAIERQNISRSSQDSTIIANEGYNGNTSNVAIQDNISRFARK